MSESTMQMKLNIVLDDNEIIEVVHSGTKTFEKWVSQFFSGRYYILEDNSEVGNFVVDTHKVKYIQIVE